jgi:hypothetical protein
MLDKDFADAGEFATVGEYDRYIKDSIVPQLDADESGKRKPKLSDYPPEMIVDY